MMKLLSKSIIFLVLLCPIFVGLNNFADVSYRFRDTITDLEALVESDKEIDVAIYGSSHAFCSYNPYLIDSISKGRSYNFGSDAQRLPVTKYIVNETFELIDPKLLVLDIYPDMFKYPETEITTNFQKSCFYFFDLTPNKLEAVFELFTLPDAIDVLFPYMRRKQFLPNFRLSGMERYKYPSKQEIEYYRGYIGFSETLAATARYNKTFHFNAETLKKDHPEYDGIRDKELQNLIDIISKAKKRNIQVLLTIAPYYRSLVEPDYPSFHKFIDKICEQYEVDFLDFNLLWEELSLNYPDFSNGSHLNISGGSKVSKYLGRYIKERYSIPSRETDSAWRFEHETIQSVIESAYDRGKITIDSPLLPDFFIHAVKGISKKK